MLKIVLNTYKKERQKERRFLETSESNLHRKGLGRVRDQVETRVSYRKSHSFTFPNNETNESRDTGHEENVYMCI